MNKVRNALLIGIIILSPFHAFFMTWLKSGAAQPGILVTLVAAWREIFVLLIGVTVVLEYLSDKKLPKFDLLDWIILAYGLLAFIWIFFQKNPYQWLWGMRFDVLPFFLLLLVRHSKWKPTAFYTKLALTIGFIVLLFGLLHALVLPKDFLTHFGYSTNLGPYQPDIAISACQKLEHMETFCRATSTFGGPTRYGTYLLLMLGLLLPFIITNYQLLITNYKKTLPWLLLVLALTNVILTFSRSIWIGAFVMAVVFFFWITPRRFKLPILLGGASLVVLGFLLLALNLEDSNKWNISTFKSLFIRDISTNEHLAYMKEGIKTVSAHPLGIGLGQAGPASIHFKKFLTENWYLQIAVEMGVVGLLLFLTILVLLSKKLLEDREDWFKRGLFLSLLGISVAGLFTHSFEETTTILLLMGICGIYLSKKHIS